MYTWYRELKPVLNWANVGSPNILRTVRRTMIRFLTELLVRSKHGSDSPNFTSFSNWLVMRLQASARTLRQTRSRQYDRKCTIKSSQVNILSSSLRRYFN